MATKNTEDKKAAAWATYVKEREALLDARNAAREAADLEYERKVAPLNRQIALLKQLVERARAKERAATEQADKKYQLDLRRAKARLEAINPAALRWA